jgi:OFA family oxalate/formate antiporter-like MFS transporter
MTISEATLDAGFAGQVARSNGYRWTQLAMGIVCMAMIANLQYGWTLFVNPIADRHGWSRAAIQVAFTIFVLTETWLVPIEGYLVDKFGPRPVVMVGGILCGLGWVLNSFADSLTLLYIAAAVGGVGAGAVYGTCVGNALKWFPDRRGLAAGLTAIVPIAAFIKSSGYEAAFLYFGIGQGVVVFLLSWFLTRAPDSKTMGISTIAVQQTRRNYTPGEVLRSPVFWVMYVMFVLVAAGGLMATAQLGPIAKDFKIGDIPVNIMGLALPALTFGWVSDKIGREQTMFIAFALEAVGILALYNFGQNPVAFVLLTGLVFFAWGEIYSLFPSTCADTFGTKFAAANAGLLYTAKGTASLLVPLSSVLAAATGSWHTVFIVASVMNALAALMAWFVLRPMRRKQMDRS